jgi:GT2 family glycosyltransferase
MKISVIVVSFNTREILRNCLLSLNNASEKLDVEIIVVDNNSHDGSADMVESDFSNCTLLRSSSNLGFAAANNWGFKIAKGEFILLLNPDAIIAPGSLERSIEYMNQNPKLGMGGGRLIDKFGNWQPSARQFPSLLNEFLTISGLAHRFPSSKFFGRADRTWDTSDEAVCVDWVPGAYAFIRKAALEQAGPFDERFFLYYEEVDLCRRFIQSGWLIAYWPDIEVKHWGGESSKTIKTQEFSKSGSQLTLWRMRSQLLYYRKHHGYLVTLGVAKLESIWHQLRAARARYQGLLEKANESNKIVQMMKRALLETEFGKNSPTRPWSLEI